MYFSKFETGYLYLAHLHYLFMFVNFIFVYFCAQFERGLQA